MKIRLIVLIVALAAAAGVIARASRPEEIPILESISGLPMQIGEWRGQDGPGIEPEVMAVLGVDDYINRIYFNERSFPASLYIGYYRSQREGDTIHSPLNCLPGAGWNPVQRGRLQIPVEGGRSIEINRISVMKGTEKQLVLYWYQSHGRVVASEYWGKIYTVLDAARTNRTDAAMVRVICPVADATKQSEREAEQYAIDFIKGLFPSLGRFLPI